MAFIWIVVAAWQSGTSRGEVLPVGFQNRYYSSHGYTGSHVLDHNETGRFDSYVEVQWTMSSLVDFEGRVWVADRVKHQILLMEPATRYVKWPSFYIVYAGTDGLNGHFDGSRKQARFDSPHGIAITQEDPMSIFVADTGNHCIRRLDFATGRTATVVGSPKIPGFRDGFGLESQFRSPMSIGVDSRGSHLFVLDNGRQIRYVALTQNPSPVITLVSGSCRGVSRWTLQQSIVMRRVGCHPDWRMEGVDDAAVADVTVCKGHFATCGPRNHPAIKDANSPGLLTRLTSPSA